MSRPFLISEALSVFIRGAKPIVLSAHETEGTRFPRGRVLFRPTVPCVSSGCRGPDVE